MFSAIARIVGVLLILSLLDRAKSEACGNEPKTNCQKSCYQRCTSRAKKEGTQQQDVKENIATEYNLCVNDCFGDRYRPLVHDDVKNLNLPQYSDFEHCLGKCAHPINQDYCLKDSYMSSFFYCDCHECCSTNSATQDVEKCTFGCYLWFKRKWSPNAGEGCRYRPEYKNSPQTYCTDFCSWALQKIDPNLPLSDIPNAIKGKKGEGCVLRCSTLLLKGQPIDYDTRLTPCSDLTECITITAFKYAVSSTNTIDYNYVESHLVSRVIFDAVPKHNGGDRVIHNGLNHNISIPTIFEVHRAFDQLHTMGVQIVAAKGSAAQTTYPSSIDASFPWLDCGNVLETSYDNIPDADTVYGQSVVIRIKRKYEIEPCMVFKTTVYAKVAKNVRVEHEVFVRVGDTESVFPLTADEIKTAITGKPGWDVLEFVGKSATNVLEMKAKGYIVAEYGFDHYFEDSCDTQSGCNRPQTPGATTLCRVDNTGSIISFGAAFGR